MLQFLFFLIAFPLFTYGIEFPSSHASLTAKAINLEELNAHCSKYSRKQGATGPRGHKGSRGSRGAKGATGTNGLSSSESQIVYFNTPLNYVPTYPFTLYSSNRSGSIPQFDLLNSNSTNSIYSSFLVPFDGIISDLTIRLDLYNSMQDPLHPIFTFTIYQSALTISIPSATTGWSSTGVAESTGTLAIGSGSSLTAAFQNLNNQAPVTAGTLLIVVISSSNLNSFEIQPANFSASFKYTPDS